MTQHKIFQLKKCMTLLIVSSLFSSTMVFAQIQTHVDTDGVNVSGAVIDDSVLYSIGGGQAVSMSSLPSMKSLSVGVGWNSNLICGDMNINTTIKNQLNGVTEGFQQIMGGVIQNATSAVASLPALILQRANPALYNLLTNGILQARLDFDRSKLTCRAMAEKMADVAGGEINWEQLSNGIAMKNAVNNNGDAIAAINQAESNKGNSGIPWLGGSNAGGKNQQPIRVVSDVTKAGYNLLNNRDVTTTDAVDSTQCTNNLICQHWHSPADAIQFAVRVLGERIHQTCDDCTKTETSAGVGLTPLIQEEYEKTAKNIHGLVTGSMAMTQENLKMAGSNALPITRGVIEALRDEPDLNVMITRLSSEVALSSVMEKALLLQRILISGSNEPNISANDLAQQSIMKESSILDREINNLKIELELRQHLTNNAATTILERNRLRAESSNSILPGDVDKNRLDLIQRPENE